MAKVKLRIRLATPPLHPNPSGKNQPESFEPQLATKRKLFSSQAENALRNHRQSY